MTGVNGLLKGFDLFTGQLVDQYHFSTDDVYSSPALCNHTLILSGQDGIIRAIDLKG